MKILFLVTTLFSSLFFGQELNKTEIDTYVNGVNKKVFREIHEGYIDNEPYSYSVERNDNKEILRIKESIGRKKIIRSDFFYQNGELIFVYKYIFNRKKDSKSKECKIYPTLNLVESKKISKCKKEESIKHGNWLYSINKTSN